MTKVLPYIKERLPIRLLLPVTVALYVASLAAGWPQTIAESALNLMLAGLLVVQFRLADDLSDVPRDRIDHPQRVLSQAVSLAPFRMLLAILWGVNAASIGLLKSLPQWAAYLLLSGGLRTWYRLSRQRQSPADDWVVGYHIVLIKYPVFVYLISPASSDSWTLPLLCAMGLVYLCGCVYEVLHDEKLRTSYSARHFLAIEMAALMSLAAVAIWGVFS